MKTIAWILVGCFIGWHYEQPLIAKQAEEIAIRAFRNAIDPPREFPKEKPPAGS